MPGVGQQLRPEIMSESTSDKATIREGDDVRWLD